MVFKFSVLYFRFQISGFYIAGFEFQVSEFSFHLLD